MPYPVEVIIEKRVRNAYDRFVSGWFWVTAILLLLIAAFYICDKIPATKPYTTLIRKIIGF